MKKKFLVGVAAFVAGVAMIPSALAVNFGTAASITSGGNVTGGTTDTVKIVYESAELNIAPAQAGGQNLEARPDGYGWLGIKITAPTDVNYNKANYYAVNVKGEKSETKLYKDYKDVAGEEDKVISLWSGINFDTLNTALTKGSDVTMSYYFDWDGNDTVDQTFIVSIDPKKVTLKKESNNVYPLESLPKVIPLLPNQDDVNVTGDGTNFVTITYKNAFELEWVKKDQDGIVRPVDGWWIGVRFDPETEKTGATFKTRANGGEWSKEYQYDTEKDQGEDYISGWILLNEEKIAGLENYVFEWTFDWDNDGIYEQTVTQIIPVKNVTLSKDGETVYPKEEVKEEPKVEEETPNTYDGISLYLILGGVSLIVLVGLVLALKKKKSIN